MEFPVLRALPLPLTALHIVTKFLRQPHPTALLIKALFFYIEEASEYHEELLRVEGPGVRNKDLSTPWPHTYIVRHKYTPYNPRWSAMDMIYSLSFSYNEQTGEPNPHDDEEDDDSDVGSVVSNSFTNSLSPWG